MGIELVLGQSPCRKDSMSDLGEQLQLHTAGHNLRLREQQREQNMWNPEKVKVSSDENPREVTQKKKIHLFFL